jgi:CRISPR-associated protein Cmr3
VGLRLDPLDVLFFRDGRPFDAAARVTAGLPNPQTLAGALRNALLARTGTFRARAFARQRQSRAAADDPTAAGQQLHEDLRRCGAPDEITGMHFRGPWLAVVLKGSETIEPLLSQPVTLVPGREGGWLRAEPLDRPPPGWTHPDGLLPLWRTGLADTKTGGGLITLAGIRQFLAGGVPDPQEAFRNGDLYDFENRIGIRVDMHTLTSAEGEICGIRLLALRSRVERDAARLAQDRYRGAEVCLYAEALGATETWAAALFDEPVPFGGEGRHVCVRRVRPCEWPEPDAGRERAVWLLASPTFFGGTGRLPRVPEPAKLRAAASAAGMAVSGWDVARNGPRPTRFAVPAGAVYFVKGTFVPPDHSLAEGEAVRAEGWGFALQGVWEGGQT